MAERIKSLGRVDEDLACSNWFSDEGRLLINLSDMVSLMVFQSMPRRLSVSSSFWSDRNRDFSTRSLDVPVLSQVESGCLKYTPRLVVLDRFGD